MRPFVWRCPNSMPTWQLTPPSHALSSQGPPSKSPQMTPERPQRYLGPIISQALALLEPPGCRPAGGEAHLGEPALPNSGVK